MKRVSLAYIKGPNDTILMGKRNDTGLWTNPGGHVEKDECPMVALAREVEEETGLIAKDFKLIKCVYKKEKNLLLYIFEVKTSGEIDTSNDPDNECDHWYYIDPISVIDHLQVEAKYNDIIKHWFEN